MKTFASLFSGGGLADIGAVQAGLKPLWGVEMEAKIAEWYARNIGDHAIVSRVQDVDYTSLEVPHWLHMSPPCTNASNANTQAGETGLDIELAQACILAIQTLRPPTISLENVYGYRHFESFKRILKVLVDEGYNVKWWHLNSANYGGWELCPVHVSKCTKKSAGNAEWLSNRVSRMRNAHDIVQLAAQMLPDDQARILAWDVMVNLVKETGPDIADLAVWREWENADNLVRQTLAGRAADMLTNEDTSGFALMGSTGASIVSLLKECLDAPSLKERWSTTSTATKQITVRKIFGCLSATQNTHQNTTENARSPLVGDQATLGSDCPLCRYRAVPQTRKRLFLVASRVHNPRKPEQTHEKKKGQQVEQLSLFPPLLPWNGWYAAIEDLIPGLPEDEFADWQIPRLPKEWLKTMLVGLQGYDGKVVVADENAPSFTVTANEKQGGLRAFLLMTGNTQIANPTGTGIKRPEEPSNTVTSGSIGARAFLANNGGENGELWRDDKAPAPVVTTQSHGRVKAFIVDGQTNDNGQSMTIRDGQEPFLTVSASQEKRAIRAYATGRVVRLTPRCLARFQSVPDSYTLPEKASLACHIIGNGVPSLMMQRLMEANL